MEWQLPSFLLPFIFLAGVIRLPLSRRRAGSDTVLLQCSSVCARSVRVVPFFSLLLVIRVVSEQ